MIFDLLDLFPLGIAEYIKTSDKFTQKYEEN